MTLPLRLRTIKQQADWHRDEAANSMTEFEKLRDRREHGETVPNSAFEKLDARTYKHHFLADTLDWAVAELEKVIGAEQSHTSESARDGSGASADDAAQTDEQTYADTPFPPEMPESKRIRDYILRYLWDAAARNPKWLKDIILQRTGEDIPQDKIARSLNKLHKRFGILEKVESEGSGYYRIRADYKASNKKP